MVHPEKPSYVHGAPARRAHCTIQCFIHPLSKSHPHSTIEKSSNPDHQNIIFILSLRSKTEKYSTIQRENKIENTEKTLGP